MRMPYKLVQLNFNINLIKSVVDRLTQMMDNFECLRGVSFKCKSARFDSMKTEIRTGKNSHSDKREGAK